MLHPVTGIPGPPSGTPTPCPAASSTDRPPASTAVTRFPGCDTIR
ncbi:hypothetical protein [Saccharothrix hoggarensis]